MLTLPSHRICGALTVLLLALSGSGCNTYLDTEYGTPQGRSINGIGSFVDLVKGTGRQVQVWRAVSERMGSDIDSVIVFHSDFEQIPKERIAHFRQLLRESSIQTFIIVARDSDCAIDYWRQVASLPELTAEEKRSADSAAANASRELKMEALREFDPEFGYYGLTHADRTNQPDVITVDVESDGVASQIKSRWLLNRKLELNDDAVVLWSTGDEPLLAEEFNHEGQRVFVLASAAPILNGGLVDPGNRQLAEDLVKLLPEGRVGISISSRWSDGKFAESPSSWRLLTVHPHGWIFGQTLLAIVLFCWWKLPIFGRPRMSVNAEAARFGKHVEALGALLQRTRDEPFARQLLRDWHRAENRRSSDKSTNKDAGTSTRK